MTHAPSFEVRPATAADLPKVAALVQSAYRGHSARAGWTHEADLLGGQRADLDMISEMAAAPDVILVGHLGGDLVACAHLAPKGDAASIGLLTIAPGHQGGGLGRTLLRAAERFAAEAMGARCARMWVIAQRAELIAYYARRGYAPTGETAPFPYGDERFGVPKRDDLSFVVLEKPLVTDGRPSRPDGGTAR